MKYLKLFENFLNEAMASTAHIEVGEEYNYKSGVQDYPPFKIKVVKIVNDKYFIGEVMEENKTTEYKGMKKGETYQLNTSYIVEETKKQLSAVNKIVEPKNELGDKIPAAKEAFDKLVNWAKENKMRTVDQSSEYSEPDIYIRLWDNGMPHSILNLIYKLTNHIYN
jgi:hypothetical protein